MSAEDLQSLTDSIGNVGVLNPITVFEGQVIDGWHRYCAANALDIACPSVELPNWVDPRDFVLAQNKTRRHITAMQLAIAATEVYAWRSTGNQIKGAGPAPLTKTVKELAEIAGVSERSIQQAKSVHTQAAPEVLQAVKRGEIGGEKAAAIARLPRAKQVAALTKPKPVKQAEEPTAPAPVDYTELDAARDQIAELQSELVVSRMNGTDEDKQQASVLIADLRAELAKLTAVLKATELSRDSLIEERAQMLRQLKAQRSELTRLKAA
jgi:ParB-like chromosome segregation protein Spo0J